MRLFLPHGGETSVFRIKKLTPLATRDLGQTEWADKQQQSKPILGWGELLAIQTRTDGLALVLDTSHDPAAPMHPRHAGIRGWPDMADEELRIAQERSVAQLLASRATLRLVAEMVPAVDQQAK